MVIQITKIKKRKLDKISSPSQGKALSEVSKEMTTKFVVFSFAFSNDF